MKSKWIWSMSTIIITVGSVFLLAILSSWFSYAAKNLDTPVLAGPNTIISLNSNNLVDEMSKLVLSAKLSKVELRQHTLSIDLKVTEQQFNAASVYESIAELMAFSMQRTDNVYQLLIRVVAEDPWTKSKYLLLAADVRKGQWPAEVLEQLRGLQNEELPREVKTWLRMTETNLWKSHF